MDPNSLWFNLTVVKSSEPSDLLFLLIQPSGIDWRILAENYNNCEAIGI